MLVRITQIEDGNVTLLCRHGTLNKRVWHLRNAEIKVI